MVLQILEVLTAPNENMEEIFVNSVENSASYDEARKLVNSVENSASYDEARKLVNSVENSASYDETRKLVNSVENSASYNEARKLKNGYTGSLKFSNNETCGRLLDMDFCIKRSSSTGNCKEYLSGQSDSEKVDTQIESLDKNNEIKLSKSLQDLSEYVELGDRVHTKNKAGRKISRMFNIFATDTGCNSDLTPIPKIKTPSILRRMSRAVEQNSDQVGKSYSESTNIRKRMSLPDELKLFNKTLTVRKSPFLGSRSSIKILSGDEKKKIFNNMLNLIQDGECKKLKLLMKRHLIDVSKTIDGVSLLHEASYKGCTKCIKNLIKNGCSQNIADESGWSPIHAAVFGNDICTVKCLLEYDISMNTLSNDGWSPLHLSVYAGKLTVVHEIMKYGGDPLLHSGLGVSPFQLAIDLKRSLILDYFLYMPACFLVRDKT